MASSPRKRSDGWNSQIRVQGHPPVSVTAPTKTLCRMLAAEREREIRAGEVNSDSRATFGELLDLYLRTNEHKRRKTSRQIEAVLETWRDRFGRVRVGQIKAATVADARDEMLRMGLSDETVRKSLNVLSGFYRWAMRERQAVKSNPVSAVTKPAEGEGRTRFLAPAERVQLFAACKLQTRTPKLYPMVVLACYGGMRRGELLALRWADIDLENGLAFVRISKNGESRPVPVLGPAREALREWADHQTGAKGINPNALVFGSKWFPNEAWERALVLSQVEDFHFHDLRHTCGSYIIQSGGGLGDVAEVLGHKTLKMAKRYAHHSPASRLRIVDRMVQAFG